MAGGGTFGLKAGQWTDDTAMALALGDWLANDPNLDPADLMSRFVRWYKEGAYSCTNTCFDIGNATREALEHFIRTEEPLAGAKNPRKAGNGALMRLSPVAIRYWNDRARLIEVARLQTATTHGADECLAASANFAELLAEVISGKPLAEALGGEPARRIKGNWRGGLKPE
jgi:ADP-ribosyl-[dinitrogen reductase] hydrolase